MAGTAMLEGRRILVTGGAGFIGSHIVDRLAPDNQVFVLDNLSTGLLANLEKNREHITFIKGDVRDKNAVQDAVRQVEYVFHLAANVGNIRSIKDPFFDMDVNIRGTLNVLDACRESGVQRVVYSSSAAIFGEAKYLPVDEDHPLHPESPYAVSKLAAEKYCFAFYKVHGVPTTCIRYFNVYGPRQDTSEYANAIAIFLGKAKRGGTITVYGDGEQTRDFINVGDVAMANVYAAARPEAVGQIFNIATGKATSITQIIALIREVSGRENPVVHAAPRAGEVRHSRANTDKVKKLLGYEPQVSLKEGLATTWKAMTDGR